MKFFNSLEALIFSTLCIAQVYGACPQNSYPWQGNCYTYFSQETAFGNAEVNCVNAGGHLASIHDGITNIAIAQQASNFIHTATNPWIWIGFNKLSSPDWSWTDGSPKNYTSWKDGEPGDKKCVKLTTADGAWLTEDCSAGRPYVCLIPQSTTGAPSTSSPRTTPSTTRPTTSKFISTTSLLTTRTTNGQHPETRSAPFTSTTVANQHPETRTLPSSSTTMNQQNPATRSTFIDNKPTTRSARTSTDRNSVSNLKILTILMSIVFVKIIFI